MKNIIFFDGVCNLCNGFVSVLIFLDRKEKLYFAPLPGKTAESYNLGFSDLKESQQSIVYINVYQERFKKSDAVIQILTDLFFFGEVFQLLKVIPSSLLDRLYLFIAKNRYKFFGLKSSCRIPSEGEKSRFLD